MAKETKKKAPHLALTHNVIQGGAANGRNVSLLMKAGVELTDDVTKALVALGINKSAFQSEISSLIRDAVCETFKDDDDDSWLYVEDYNDSIVIFCTDDGLYSVGYSLVDGKVMLDDLANPVVRAVTYNPTTGDMLLSEDAEEKLEEGIYSLVTKALQNPTTLEHLALMFKAQLKVNEVEILEQEIKKAVDAAELILKAQLKEKDEALEKALADVAAFTADKLEVLAKARKESLAAVVSDEEAESLYKATESLGDEAFAAIVKSFGIKAGIEKESDLFKEKGIGGEGEPVKQEQAALNLVGELINKSKKTK